MLIGIYTVHRPIHVAYHNRTIFEQQHDSYVQLIKLKQFNHDENYVYRVFRENNLEMVFDKGIFLLLYLADEKKTEIRLKPEKWQPCIQQEWSGDSDER